jgi:hypothetical protein
MLVLHVTGVLITSSITLFALPSTVIERLESVIPPLKSAVQEILLAVISENEPVTALQLAH